MHVLTWSLTLSQGKSTDAKNVQEQGAEENIWTVALERPLRAARNGRSRRRSLPRHAENICLRLRFWIVARDHGVS
jgi:hypothetical protein